MEPADVITARRVLERMHKVGYAHKQVYMCMTIHDSHWDVDVVYTDFKDAKTWFDSQTWHARIIYLPKGELKESK